MKYILFSAIILSLTLFFSSCKKNESQSNEILDSPEIQLPEAPVLIPEDLDTSILTDFEWEISHVLDNGQMQIEHEYIQSILTFDSEGNYNWEGENLKNEGRWTFDENRTIILLESSNPDYTSEWTVKHKRSVMVWIGTPKYGHNSIQMMMNKVREF